MFVVASKVTFRTSFQLDGLAIVLAAVNCGPVDGKATPKFRRSLGPLEEPTVGSGRSRLSAKSALMISALTTDGATTKASTTAAVCHFLRELINATPHFETHPKRCDANVNAQSSDGC